MKLRINYDLLDKINQSKNGARLYKSDMAVLKDPICKFPFFCFCGSYVASFILDKNFGMILTIILAGFCGTSALIINSFFKDIRKDREEDAKKELEHLVTWLHSLEVKTTLESLKDAKINQTNYKIIFSDADIKIPRLKQYKYIDIPLSNGYEEIILQEHVFGNEEYEISVNEPVKKKTFRVAKNNI